MDIENTVEPHEELSDILNGEAPVDLNAAEPEPKVEENTGEQLNQDEAVTAASPVEPAPEEKPEEVPPTSKANADSDARFNAMLAKSQDEVAKRQALERQVEALTQQVNATPKEEAIDPYEDPEGFQKQVNTGLESRIQEQQAALQQTQTQDRVAMSEMVVKVNVGAEKYDPAIAAFETAAKANPALVTAMLAAPIPAQYAYEQGNSILFMKEVGDNPEAYKERLKKELIAELAGKTAVDEKQATIDGLPKTIANAGTAAPQANQLPDESLATLLGET